MAAPAFEGASPTEIIGQVLGGDAVEAVEPLLEAAVVGVDGVDVGWGASGAGFPGASTAWTGIPALRAKAAIGRPPSPIRWLPGVTIPASAAPMEAPST